MNGNIKKYQNLFNIAKERGYTNKEELQELIEWVFRDEMIQYPDGMSSWHAFVIEHLEFWYKTLIPELYNCKYISKPCIIHDYCDVKECNTRDTLLQGESIQNNEFVLEGFIGILMNWFESHNITIEYYNSEYHVTGKIDNGIIEYNTIYEITPDKQPARHEAILECFKLMRTN